MKNKSIIAVIFATLISFNSVANDSANNPVTNLTQSDSFSASRGGDALIFSQSAGNNSTSTRTLVAASSHHCALSFSESNKDNHTSARVYRSGALWYLQVWSVGSGGYKRGEAVCWPR